MYDDNDPDWLAYVLCGLHEIDDDRNPLPVVEGPSSTAGKPLKGFPPVLDIFARLLTYAEKGQVTAVAFRPISAAHLATFVVAQTSGVTDDVVNHVLYLVSHCISGGSASSTPGRVQCRKNSRDERFVKLVADVLDGPPADQRADCDGEEKRTLKALQDCSGADRERLQRVGESIAFITYHFEHKRSRLAEEGGRYKIPEADRDVLIELRLNCHNIYSLMKEGRHLWPLCTDYIRVRCPSEDTRAQNASASTQETGTKKAAILVSVTVDYLALRRAAFSSTMAGALFDDRGRPPTVIRVPKDKERPRAKTADISEERLKATLVKAGWEDVGDEEYAEVVDNLHPSVQSADNSSSDSGKVHPFVHCACALLAHLHDEGIEEIVAYIGVSKPSCGLCATFFACYREVTGSGITTRGSGTHGQLVQWLMPSLSDTHVDAPLRAKKCEKLLEKLKAQASEVRKHLRNSSQSNVDSLPGLGPLGEEMQLPDDDEAWAAIEHRLLVMGGAI